MATTFDTYVIEVPRHPCVLHSISPDLMVHSHRCGALNVGTTFDSFLAESSDTNSKVVVAAEADIRHRFEVIFVSVYTGTTKPAAESSLVFSADTGSGAVEIGRVNIPAEADAVYEFMLIWPGPRDYTANSDLTCQLQDALGTGYSYSVHGSFWIKT